MERCVDGAEGHVVGNVFKKMPVGRVSRQPEEGFRCCLMSSKIFYFILFFVLDKIRLCRATCIDF